MSEFVKDDVVIFLSDIDVGNGGPNVSRIAKAGDSAIFLKYGVNEQGGEFCFVLVGGQYDEDIQVSVYPEEIEREEESEGR